MTTPGKRGLGVAGALDHAVIRAIAPEAEAAGMASFWVNDTPDGDGLAALAVVAAETSRMRLAVGVIPVDRVPAATIAARVAELGLPRERMLIGIGSGQTKAGAVDLVRAAARDLRETYGLRVVIGALGPRMIEAGATDADGVLLNWLIPSAAAASAAVVRQIAPTADVIAYVRVSLGEAARERLEAEALRYEGYPAYAAHFGRMGVRANDTCVPATSDAGLRSGLVAFDAVVDEVVARAITAEDGVEHYLRTLAAVTGMPA